jgi:hypothetical protein
MAPKGKYTRSRLAAAAAQSASSARTDLPNSEALEALTCEYVHAPDETNANIDGSLRRGALLTFRWRLKTKAGQEERCDVTARTDNITERGVPLPPHWWTAMQCLSLERLCEASAANVDDPGISNVQCAVIGQAKETQPPSPDGVGEGRTVALQVDGVRVVFLLCAHVQDGLLQALPGCGRSLRIST